MTSVEPTDGLPVPRRYWSVAAIFLALTMAVLDGAIANVALPTIGRDLHASASSSIWIINAYQLTTMVLVLPLASLGERLGYRRIYIGGLAVFTLGSLACALSHTLPQLTAARVLQGMGASGIMSINAALVRFTYPKRLLAHGLGLNAVVISMAAALGPTVASSILAVASWQWLFAVNVPLGLLTVVVGVVALPRTEGSHRPFDVISALLSAAAFGLLVLGADSLVRDSLPKGAAMVVVALAAGTALVRREWSQPAPLIPLDLLRIPIFRLSICTSVAAFAAQMLGGVSLPFDLQGAMGRSVLATGLLMTPWPLGTALAAPLGARLCQRYSAGVLGAIGLGVMALGLALLAMLGPGASDLDIVWRMALCGAGFGFFQTPNNRTMIGAAPMARSGAAGGMLSTARLSGQVIGAGVVGVLFHLAGARAVDMALILAACAAATAAGVSLLRTRIATV